MNENLNFKVARLQKIANNSRLRAFADMNINDQLIIKGVRVVEGPTGLFVAMPQEKGKNNKWYETVRCLSKEVRDSIAKEVLSVYEEKLK